MANTNVDHTLNEMAVLGKLPNGKYLTVPRWGRVKREVEVKDGAVKLSGGRFEFSLDHFFTVNDIVASLN